MAKYEQHFTGDFDDFSDYLYKNIIKSSVSVSLEDRSDIILEDTKLSVQVYERYSMIGENRVSLSVTILGEKDDIFVSVITSGGSQAVFFKLNTFGEEAFLDICIRIIEDYLR